MWGMSRTPILHRVSYIMEISIYKICDRKRRYKLCHKLSHFMERINLYQQITNTASSNSSCSLHLLSCSASKLTVETFFTVSELIFFHTTCKLNYLFRGCHLSYAVPTLKCVGECVPTCLVLCCVFSKHLLLTTNQ